MLAKVVDFGLRMSIAYRLENRLNSGTWITLGDASMEQVTMLLGAIDGIKNTLFSLVKLRDQKVHFSIIIAM